VVTARRGATKLGCLVQMMVLVTLGYFGVNFGEAYWRYLKYRDAMRAEVEFRAGQPIPQIQSRLARVADSLGLPEDAGIVLVRKERGVITIEAHYEETIELPGFRRDIHFEPRAQGNY
jgi:hypothetical protein